MILAMYDHKDEYAKGRNIFLRRWRAREPDLRVDVGRGVNLIEG